MAQERVSEVTTAIHSTLPMMRIDGDTQAQAIGFELTIVIPTRNERSNILPLIERLQKTLDGINWEAVFVDDDSPDGTADVVRQIAQTSVRIRCVQRIGRRGLSSACIEGVLSSAAPFVAVIDADLQHDDRLLPQMLETLKSEDLDVVIGSRHAVGGGLGKFAESRRKISRVAARLARTMLGTQLLDPMSGFFLIRRTAFDRAVRQLSGHGFKILLDLFASSPQPLRFKELPYIFQERQSGESKLDAAIVMEYVNLLLEKTVGRFVPVTFIWFGLVGAFGVVVNLAVLAFALTLTSFTMAKVAATFVAMTTNFALNNVLTYRDVRLKGWRVLTGLLSFYAICSFGAVADVGVASLLFFGEHTSWWLSGFAGVIVGTVWNYAMVSSYTWHKR